MKLYDMHCHSSYSEDCEIPLPNMCRSAIDKGLEGIAFTEHVDFNPADKGYGYYDKEAYLSAIDDMKSRFGREMKILKGVEFSEPHLYPAEYSEITAGDWDVIIGSVHMIGDRFAGDFEFDGDLTLEKLNRDYFSIVKDLVSAGGFDVLAHMDFPKRYYGKASVPENLIDDILKLLVEKDIALEINTSPLRKGLDECSPHYGLLKKYASFGGRKITLGSDAHLPDDIAADFQQAGTMCRSIPELVIGHFSGRKFIAN